MPLDEIDIPGALRPRNRSAPKVDPHRVPRFRSSLLARLAREPAAPADERSSDPGARPEGRSTDLHSGERRCVVKARYVRTTKADSGAARLHLRYLERDGVELDGSPGRLYGADSSFDRKAFVEPIEGERHQFRFIVSPEDGREIDLTAYARRLMRQVEADLGRPLDWAAVNHFNTDNPHIHVVVRGVDRDGVALRIAPRYISHGMRESAERLLTRQLGLRTEDDLARQRAREVGAERFTSLDRALADLAGKERTVTERGLRGVSSMQKLPLHARLATLGRLGLAERRGAAWVLDDEWERRLRELGMRGDIIKRMAASVSGELGPHRVLDGVPGQPFEGVVRGLGLHDELAGTYFAAVGSRAGETFYVQVPDPAMQSLEVGDVVRVSAEVESWLKPNDRVVAKFAELHGGLYDPGVHERELTRARGGREEGLPPAVLVQSNVRRLERLAKFGLAERQLGGRWKIPVDLVKRLEERQAARPPEIRVSKVGPSLEAQVKYEGPTWLDRVRVDGGGVARHGFGAELAQAKRARAEFLRGLGIDLGRADAGAALQDLERRGLGRQIRERTGQELVPASAGFRGEIVERCPPPSGNVYLRVVDPSGRRFALLDGRGSSLAVGDRIELRLGADGRLEAQRFAGRSRGRE